MPPNDQEALSALVDGELRAEEADALLGRLAEDAGHSLRRALLDPCLAVLSDVRPARLHVIPDDFLCLLPLDALPGNESRFLGETFAVRAEATARWIAFPRSTFRASPYGVGSWLGNSQVRSSPPWSAGRLIETSFSRRLRM